MGVINFTLPVKHDQNITKVVNSPDQTKDMKSLMMVKLNVQVAMIHYLAFPTIIVM